MRQLSTYLCGVALASAAALASCTDMDEFPQDKLSPQSYFGTATELELYTNQFYALMPSVGSDFNWYLEQGEHIVTPVLNRAILGTRIIPTNAGDVGWSWTSLRKINYYLQHSSRCTDRAARDRYDGVAYFFRAYFYYNMLTNFGELPWYDQPLGSDQDNLLKQPHHRRLRQRLQAAARGPRHLAGQPLDRPGAQVARLPV